MNSNILMRMSVVCCVAGAVDDRELAEPPPGVYETTTEPDDLTLPPAPVPTPAPPPVYNTSTTTPAPVDIWHETYTTTPPVARELAPPVYNATGTTTPPAGTYTTTPVARELIRDRELAPPVYNSTGIITPVPAGTYTYTPAGTYTYTPPATQTYTPAAYFAMHQAPTEKKGQSLLQRMTDTPITFGLFSLLVAAAAVGMIVRTARSYRHSRRLTFAGRRVSRDADYGVGPDDIETNQLLIE